MTKLFIALFAMFSLLSTCENGKEKHGTHDEDSSKVEHPTEAHDSILDAYQTPPIIDNKKLPIKKNDTI